MEPDSRRFTLEAPDGFVVHVLDPLPEHLSVGDTLGIEDNLWQQWQEYWAGGPPDMNAEWFEMDELKSRTFDNKVWIPLYADHPISEVGETGYVGFREEYFVAYSFIVPKNQKAAALDLEIDVMGGFDHKPSVDEDEVFHPAIDWDCDNVKGWHPVLVQHIEVERVHELHINQDIILALGLKKTGDAWVRPEEDYIEVIKLIRDRDLKAIRIEIRAEFLKDYLCATNSGLILHTYQSRKAVAESLAAFKSDHDEAGGPSANYEWRGSVREVFEGNSLLDVLGQAVVSRAWRIDTDYDEDIPSYEFPGKTASETFEVKSSGRKVSQAAGELWKKEWIEPAALSSRVRRDKISSQLQFIVDNEGHRETSATLLSPSRWLWFHPDVVNDLLKKPNGTLTWYSEDTGGVGGAWNRSVHFGVNALGLVNVYAKDIALLPEIDKKTWANHNLSPDGKVSAELLMSQMQTNPAATDAPERIFLNLINEIQRLSKAKFGEELLRQHWSADEISKRINRFHASTLAGFYSLCKEITRFLIERIDVGVLKQLKTETDNKLGSLKRLERIFTALGYDGGKLLGVLVGVYELRLADAHLPSSIDIKDAMGLVGIDYDDLKFNAGKRLLDNVNAALVQIKDALENGDFSKLSNSA
jgi:hypothetical protein